MVSLHLSTINLGKQLIPMNWFHMIGVIGLTFLATRRFRTNSPSILTAPCTTGPVSNVNAQTQLQHFWSHSVIGLACCWAIQRGQSDQTLQRKSRQLPLCGVFQWRKISSMSFGKMVVAQCNVGCNILQSTFCEANISTTLVHFSTQHCKGFFESSDCSFSSSIALVLLRSCTANQECVLVRTGSDQFRYCTFGISMQDNGGR